MIRRAENRDIPGVLELLKQVCEVHATGRPDIFKLGGTKYTEDDLKKIFVDDMLPVFVNVDADENVMGYLFGIYEIVEESTCMHPMKRLYIDDLCVDEDHRRMGVGEELYHYAVNEAKENGCDQITLHVWELNPGARKFYEKMGMVPLQTTMETML